MLGKSSPTYNVGIQKNTKRRTHSPDFTNANHILRTYYVLTYFKKKKVFKR